MTDHTAEPLSAEEALALLIQSADDYETQARERHVWDEGGSVETVVRGIQQYRARVSAGPGLDGTGARLDALLDELVLSGWPGKFDARERAALAELGYTQASAGPGLDERIMAEAIIALNHHVPAPLTASLSARILIAEYNRLAETDLGA